MQLYQGDCLEVMKQIPDKSVDMILCDLPYGTTACKWDTVIPFDKMWEQYNRIIKDDGVIVLFGQEPFSSHLRLSNLKNYRYDYIWKKERPTNPLNCTKQPPRYTENISVFYKKQPTYNPQKTKRPEENKRNNKATKYVDETKNINTDKYNDRVLSGMNDFIYTSNVLSFSMERGLHPTEKPVGLMEILIANSTKENDIVLDSFCGAGATCVAAKNLKRRFIGIEIDENYYNIANERINKTEQQLTMEF